MKLVQHLPSLFFFLVLNPCLMSCMMSAAVYFYLLKALHRDLVALPGKQHKMGHLPCAKAGSLIIIIMKLRYSSSPK